MSNKYEEYKRFYDLGVWDTKKLRLAVEKGKLTPEEYERISGEQY